jgi:glycosyltransferase involved in cell wall biosynthesis
MKLPISVVIITLNEAQNIERCLRSVPWADELLVLDSGSQDKTTEIAKKLGATVFSEPWRGFGPQKKRAVALARNDWVLCLDADEALSPELAVEILEKFSGFDAETAYFLPRKSFYLGRWIVHGGWFPDYQLRIFDRRHSDWSEAAIHEKVLAKKTARLTAPIQHYVFDNIAEQVDTNNRYSSLQAEEHFQKNQKFYFYKLLVKPLSKFIECYLLKLGFLDGFAGFFIAVSAAYSVFIRWSKVWELERLGK